MPSAPDIRAHLKSLVGREVSTVTGAPNWILRVEGDTAFVRTRATRSAEGAPVSVAMVQSAADQLFREGKLILAAEELDRRSAFVGAALGALPGVDQAVAPARLLLVARSRRRRHGGVPERWWTGAEEERFWLEVSGREKFGVDLRAPDDNRTSHVLVREVLKGDLIFHYSKRTRSIVGWSEVAGRPRHVDGEYRTPLGGMLGLTDVDLTRLREFDTVIREVAADMTDHGSELRGFPFERSNSRVVRPLPAYLSKLPRRIVDAIPELAEAAALSPGALSVPPRGDAAKGAHRVGGVYRPANEGVTIPFISSVESEAWRAERAAQRAERSTREHHRLQNRLERYLKAQGVSTLSPEVGDAPFDLAWGTENGLAFAEVKSLPIGNSSQRLRLGLGQCLFYRHGLKERLGGCVAAFLVVPREPEDPAWADVCNDAGVTLAWPDRFAELLTY
jgi:hypothetical protein